MSFRYKTLPLNKQTILVSYYTTHTKVNECITLCLKSTDVVALLLQEEITFTEQFLLPFFYFFCIAHLYTQCSRLQNCVLIFSVTRHQVATL